MDENKIYNAFDKKIIHTEIYLWAGICIVFFIGMVVSAVCTILNLTIGLVLAGIFGFMFLFFAKATYEGIARIGKKIRIDGNKIYLHNFFGSSIKEIKNTEYVCFDIFVRESVSFMRQTREDYGRMFGKVFLDPSIATEPDYMSFAEDVAGKCLVFSNGKQIICNDFVYQYAHCAQNDIIVIQNPELIKELLKLDILKHYIPTTNPFE